MKRRGRESLDTLEDEIRDHIRREAEENIARGMAPADAYAAARRAFGNTTLTREAARSVWIPGWWDHLLQDMRFALRLGRRAPGFSIVVVLTLALGIGLNTAVFSVVNAVLVRPLAYPHSERLVWIAPSNAGGQDDVVTSPDFLVWRDGASVFDQLAGFLTVAEPIDVGDEVVQAHVAAVTEGFWDLAGASFVLGGPPLPGQDGVVLTHPTFERWFHADASVVGRPVMVGGRPNVVTGVLRVGFQPQLALSPVFVATGAGTIDVYRANVIRPAAGAGVQILNVVGRLKPGTSLERAREELERLREARQQANPQAGEQAHLRVIPYAEKVVGDARKPLVILQAAVAVVLLIVCVNTAILLLVRGIAREREIAIRAAIGAGRGRVVRQLMAESLLLSIIGCVGGLLVAHGAVTLMQRILPQAAPRLSETSIDGRVLAFALGISLVSTIVFALVPALLARTVHVYDTLKDGGRDTSSSARRVRIRGALVALEVALTVVLLVAAGLMVKSFWHLTNYPPGFQPDRVLTMRVQFSGSRYREPQNRRAFIDEMLRRTAAAPGVDAAGVGSNGGAMMLLTIEGRPDSPPEHKPRGVLSSASEAYAAAIGLRVVQGRWLTDHERTPVFVINETLARQAFPGEDPIGKAIRLPFVDSPNSFAPVVGVVADLRYSKLGTAPEPELFMDYAHARVAGTTLTVRTDSDPMSIAPSLRTLLSSIDRTQPLFDVKRLDVALADSIAPRRLNLLLLGTFALSALLLVVVGIYGVVAYAVAQRTQEMGIRIALGASRAQMVAMVVSQGMVITLWGIAMGLAAAVASTRVMTALLYEVTPTDVATFAAAGATVGATALAACCGPAVRASLVDPLRALHYE
jgi:putative ABC transport system permease protein